MNGIFLGYADKARTSALGDIFQPCYVLINRDIEICYCFTKENLQQLNVGVKVIIDSKVAKYGPNEGSTFLRIKPIKLAKKLEPIEFNIGV